MPINPISKMNQGLLLLSTAALLFGACKQEEQSLPTKATHTSAIAQVKAQKVPLYRSAPGQTVSKQQSQISSRMMGFITEMNVKEGDLVRKGQILATIDPNDVEGHLEIAEASKAQASAALADAKADWERFDRLYKENAVTKAQWEKMKLNLEMAEQRAQQAFSGFKIASSQKKYTHIKSPIDGVVSKKMLNKGDLATPGYPLLTIENPKTLEVVTQVPTAFYSKIKSDAEICYYKESAQYCDLKIQNSVPVADPMSHTHLLKLSVPSNSPLQAGAFVEVFFPLGEEEVIAINPNHMVNRAGIQGVFVLTAEQEAQFRMVRTEALHGQAANSKVLVQAGLSAGEIILTENLERIQNADIIQVSQKLEVAHD